MIEPDLPPTRPSTLPTTVGGGVFGGTTRTSIAGRYRLVRSIGAGGHAEVWEAVDGLSAARVALKLLPQVQGPERARVRREIAALRRLCVPGVVRLLDEGVDGDLAYLAMELVEGAPFPGSRGPRAWASLEGVAVALLETLSRIHALGLVHRDLKPGNVLVRADGFPTVLDFGVSLGSVSSNTPLTQDGQILGTPAYLSPEQIHGRAITPAADLYAVGVMLYEALSGRLPHPAPLVHGTFYARLTQRPPPLSDVAPEVPAHVCEAVAAMLEIEPERRPRSAAEAIDRLRGHAEAHLRSPLLPRLGEDVLRELVDAATTDRPVDLVGDRGTGRSRLLDDLSRALEAHGRVVLRTAPSRQPFGSLEPVVGPLDPHADSSLDVVVRAVREGLAARLRERAVLLVDDVERVDVWSADVIDRLRCDGAVVRVFLPDGHADPTTTLELKPLSEADLRPLFRGPERLFHLTSDAARALHARTGGHPARVSAELGAWRRAGLARVDGDRFVVDRDTLDRLDAHTRLMPPVRSSELQHELPPHLYDLLRWISLAWPHGSVELLSRAMRQPRWRVAAEAEELVRRGLAQRSRDGRLEPLRTTLPEQYWDFSQHLRAHRALAEALPPGTDGRLHHVLAGGPASDAPEDYAALAREVVREAVGFGLRRARDGWLGHATAILSESLLGVRELTNDAPSAEVLAPLLGLWAEVALADGTPQALDRALYEISKLPARGDALDRIEALLRAALAVGQGGERALHLVESIAPFDDPWLERRRLGVRVMAARRCSSDREERVLAELEADPTLDRDPTLRAARAGWLGRLRYRQHRFAEAAALHDVAAAEEPWLALRIEALVNAASAAMEAFDDAGAAERAAKACALAARCRHPYFEARAEWILRSSAYRNGCVGAVDEELLEAVRHLGMVDICAMVHLTEAAVAWRGGDLARARRLALEAWGPWRATGWVRGEVLVRALALACGEPLEPGEVDVLLARARACDAPRIALQVMALVVRARPERREGLRAEAEALARSVPEPARARRLEVLSVAEASATLAGGPHEAGESVSPAAIG